MAQLELKAANVTRRKLLLGSTVLGLATLWPTPAQASSLPFSFNDNSYLLVDLAREHLPYYSSVAGPLQGDLQFDSEGIAVRRIGATDFDHPVLQAQYMMQRLSSYYVNNDPAYLASVERHAQRIMSYAIESRGAAYLPYPFDFNLHGNSAQRLRAPWYSGMAQGQALGAFSRLAVLTGRKLYHDFADRLFASFMNLERVGMPWTVTLDPMGNLWFEEYPLPDGLSDRALNGHIFAIYGLYDYWQMTRLTDAKSLISGGITAVAVLIDQLRNQDGASFYCLSHRVASSSYHIVHVGQLYQLFAYTKDSVFAVKGDQLISDFPTSQKGGRAYLANGEHVGIAIPADGQVSRTVIRLESPEAATSDARARLPGMHGVHLRITTGSLSGFWVQEIPGRSFVRLYLEGYRFVHPRLLRLERGTYSGHKFNENGAVAHRRTATLSRDSAAHVNQRVLVNGSLYFKIVDGIWAGWWMRDEPGLSLV